MTNRGESALLDSPTSFFYAPVSLEFAMSQFLQLAALCSDEPTVGLLVGQQADLR